MMCRNGELGAAKAAQGQHSRLTLDAARIYVTASWRRTAATPASSLSFEQTDLDEPLAQIIISKDWLGITIGLLRTNALGQGRY